MIPIDFTQSPKTLPINMYLHPKADHGKPAMVGFPGYTLQDSETGIAKAMLQLYEYIWVVIGNHLYYMNPTAASPTLTLAKTSFIGGSGSVINMVTDGAYICATTNDKYVYWYKISDASNGSVDLSSILGSSYTTGLTCQDGYFIACAQTKYFCISDLNDPTTWNALSYEDEEYKPDKTITPYSFGNKLFIFGTDTYAIYENTGNPDFPFERIPGAVFDVGIASPWSVLHLNTGSPVIHDAAMYFYASDGTIRRITSFSSEIISTPEVNEKLNENQIELTNLYKVAVDGMVFIVVYNGSVTVAYNTTTGLWCQLKSGTAGASNYPGRCSVIWRPTTNSYKYITAIGLSDGKIVELEGFTENTAAQYREVQSEVIDANRERMLFGSLKIYAKTAVGSTTVNPTISVQWSDDQGSTWSTARTLYLGLSDKTGIQLSTHRLGSSYGRVFKISSSNIYELQLYGAYIE